MENCFSYILLKQGSLGEFLIHLKEAILSDILTLLTSHFKSGHVGAEFGRVFFFIVASSYYSDIQHCFCIFMKIHSCSNLMPMLFLLYLLALTSQNELHNIKGKLYLHKCLLLANPHLGKNIAGIIFFFIILHWILVTFDLESVS